MERSKHIKQPTVSEPPRPSVLDTPAIMTIHYVLFTNPESTADSVVNVACGQRGVINVTRG
jgi:hypothetical protein